MNTDYLKQTAWLHLNPWLQLRENKLGQEEFEDLVMKWQASIDSEIITHGWVTQNCEYFESELGSWTTTGKFPKDEPEMGKLLRITAAGLCDSLVANGGISHLYDDPLAATAPAFSEFLKEIGLSRYSRIVYESVVAIGKENLASSELRQVRLNDDEVMNALEELDEQMHLPWAGSLFSRKCDCLLKEWMESVIYDAYCKRNKK
jgi:hypothetical protein